jgi:hypothetical protein
MRFLCLAYGDGKDWEALSDDERAASSAADEVLRRRGDMLAVVENVTTVRAWDGVPSLTDGPFATGDAPLVGFSLIDAEDLDEAIRLVSSTPCARAKGAVEVWPIRE